MKTKKQFTQAFFAATHFNKNKTWLLMLLIGCSMSFHQASAQNPPANGGGTGNERWTLNNNDSNQWTQLRMQTSNNKAWNMVNQGDLFWAYAADDYHPSIGTEKMRLTYNGKLGIGTDNPNATLHVKKNGASQLIVEPVSDTGQDAVVKIIGHRNVSTTDNQAKLVFQNFDNDLSGTNTLGKIVGKVTDAANNTGALVFYNYANGTNSAETMRLTHDGKVGIGTTSPNGKLHIVGSDNDGTTAALSVGSPSQQMLLDGNEIDAKLTELWLNNNSAHNVIIANGGGNVGIGTDSPSDKLTVYDGEFTLQTDDNTQEQGMLFQNSAGSYTWRMYRADAGNYEADLKFASGSTSDFTQLQDRMILKTGGNVGIGTMSPTEKLEVNGTVKATSFTSSAASFPDYVFAEDYKITPLSELEAYVKTNKRLPNMPSEKEVVEQGLNMPEVLTKSVENIETIYLHLIRMEKEIKALQQENAALKQQLQQGR